MLCTLQLVTAGKGVSEWEAARDDYTPLEEADEDEEEEVQEVSRTGHMTCQHTTVTGAYSVREGSHIGSSVHSLISCSFRDNLLFISLVPYLFFPASLLPRL